MLKKELLDVLCCPKDQADLDYRPEKNVLICKSCKNEYEVREDIPIMIIEDEHESEQ